MPARRVVQSVAASFGAELRKARANADLTQQVVAERADIDPVFVSFLENGHRQPSLAVLLSLERALGLAAGELVRRTADRLASGEGSKSNRGARKTRVKD